MLVKIITLFLVVMAILALFGRFKIKKPSLKKTKFCADCGRPRIGKGPCPCKSSGA